MLLRLQEVVQEILSKYDLLNRFLDQTNKEVKIEFQNKQKSLVIARVDKRITVMYKDPYYLFEFKLYKTPKWGEVSCCVGENYYPILINDGGSPAFSGKGYALFEEYSAELSHELDIEDWLNKAELVGAQEPKPHPVKQDIKLPEERFSRFQAVIHKILKKHGLMDAFYDSLCESVYLKLHQKVYMDLVIERQNSTVLVGHYREQNGDLISDPVLVFQINEGLRAWAPMRIEQVFGDTQIMFRSEDKTLFYPKRLKSFKSFANMFASNISDQGWMEAEVVDQHCVFEKAEEPKPEIPNIIEDHPGDIVGQMAFAF